MERNLPGRKTLISTYKEVINICKLYISIYKNVLTEYLRLFFLSFRLEMLCQTNHWSTDFLGWRLLELVTLERLCCLLVVIGWVERSNERPEPLVSCFRLLPIFEFLHVTEPGWTCILLLDLERKNPPNECNALISWFSLEE